MSLLFNQLHVFGPYIFFVIVKQLDVMLIKYKRIVTPNDILIVLMNRRFD